MKTYYECLPCFVNQTLDAVRQFSGDGVKNNQVLRKVLHEMSKMDFNESPPRMGQLIHRIIRHYLGDNDPYLQIKKRYNNFALKLYPEFKKRVELSGNPFETAVRLTIGANIIDYGVISNLDDSSVYDTIESSLKEQLSSDDIKEFESAVNRATDILYLGDNTGEIVFDRLLIEQILPRKVTFAVRGSPIINDVTIAAIADANYLIYDDAASVWKNQAISGAFTSTKAGVTTLSASIDATKIADGTVTNAEFQYVNTLSSNAQTQIDTKATAGFAVAMAIAL